ncbi:MAG: hypothetical protein A2091_08245 [Desulfuromonadales bacterium GWD2_61_12]|nr:MAG: hypothetical protein A2005_08650 [Desulfuromonadales bacterium GWC2_61_20]OGR33686.1 MAG: hypothetical protein A2091_08245 [Desulfuromonadales bacterium GWD2_61_12]HAD03256.1 hypothetical protein [Desulfuromonas sp.]HBT83769.1 hypothetical protein [Desulfuromonas sp.]
MPGSLPTIARIDVAAFGVTTLLLFLVVKLHLLAALFSGLLVYEMVNVLAPRLRIENLLPGRAKLVAVAILAAIIVGTLTLAVFSTLTFFRGGTESIPKLIRMMAEIIEGSRDKLPTALASYLPDNVVELKGDTAAWLRQHVAEVKVAGEAVTRKTAHILIGMVIGALLALREALPEQPMGPLASALEDRAERFGTAFRRVVFAQARIAAINTLLTGFYLAAALPLFGIDLPFTKTLILVTFVASLLPVIGNLISNTVIVVVSLSVSLDLAVASLGFLVVIHKLEYFINAKIVGLHINARAWELLIAMLVMEAAFGIVGLIAAPVYYAYLKEEMRSHGLI